MTKPESIDCLPPELEQLASKPFKRIVVFSGAGISAESGIATFRGAQDGLWARFNPADLATPEAWDARRSTVWAWYEWRRSQVIAAKPNPGHIAAAELQQASIASVVTQNVDDLHERAGANDVVHLHGTIMQGRCSACSKPHKLSEPAPLALESEPPRCVHCGGWVRPSVVWFGEALPTPAIDEARARIARADLLLVVGTSGVVQPAAGLVRLVRSDCAVLEINPASNNQFQGRRWSWAAPAGRALPLLAQRLLDH
jgi:NAD-dependent deacetylase